jgi:hypothetical protein
VHAVPPVRDAGVAAGEGVWHRELLADGAATNNGNLDAWVSVQHSIEPRADRDPSKKDAQATWRGAAGTSSWRDGRHVLRESGFKQFPAVCRGGRSGGDIYGNSPGMEALGDVKQLQHEQLRKAKGIDYQTNPPLQVPDELKNRTSDRLPGASPTSTRLGRGSHQDGVRCEPQPAAPA